VVAVGIIVMVGFVRWRGDYSPGLGIPLANALGIEGGALIFQPKTLKGIKARAEAASRQ
jgi:hypothetical protein